MNRQLADSITGRLQRAHIERKPLVLADLRLGNLGNRYLEDLARSLAGKVPTKLDYLLWKQAVSGKSVVLNPATNEKD